MKFIYLILGSIFLVLSVQSCNKSEPFKDVCLLNEWVLQAYYHENGDLVSEKPDDLPRDILLVIRENNIISGFISSFSIDGTYTLTEEREFSLELIYPKLPTCCEWDDLFIEAYITVERYDCDGNTLRLYYNEGANFMLFNN